MNRYSGIVLLILLFFTIRSGYPNPLPLEQHLSGKPLAQGTSNTSNSIYATQEQPFFKVHQPNDGGTDSSFAKETGNRSGNDSYQEPRNHQLPSTDLIGGPDAFGYRFIDNQDAAFPTELGWITPSDFAVTQFWSGDDGALGPFTFPGGFTFPFYGSSYSSFYIQNNGYLMFGSSTTGYIGCPSVNAPASIYFFSGDMNMVSGTTIVRTELLTNPSRWCMTLTDYRWYPNSGNANVQVVLYETGEILINYGTITYYGSGYPLAAGIQNFQATTYLAYGRPLIQNCSVYFYKLGAPSNPIPADSSTYTLSDYPSLTLGWQASAGTPPITYSIKFDQVNPPIVQVTTSLSETQYRVPTLLSLGTYHWQVTASNGLCTTPGPIWSFTVVPPILPGVVTNPSPSDNATNVSTHPVLSWHHSANTMSYILMLDTVPVLTSVFQGNLFDTTFSIASALRPSTDYFWQIVSIGGMAMTYSPIWHFTTAAVPTTPTITSIQIVDNYPTLTWEASPNANGYNIYRATNGLFTPSMVTLYRTLGNVVTWTDSSASLAGEQYYRVTGVNNATDELLHNESNAQNGITNQREMRK